MSVRDELLKHADRIEHGVLTWVPSFPTTAGECCAAFWMPTDDGLGQLSEEAKQALCDHLDLDPGSDDEYGNAIGRWNDKQLTARPIMAALRAAAVNITDDEGGK